MTDKNLGVTFATGARRSERKPRFDLLLTLQAPLRRVSDRFEMGLRYGEHNYKKGLEFDDTINHVVDHLMSYLRRRKRFFELQQNEPSRLEQEYQMLMEGKARSTVAHSGDFPTQYIPSLEEWMKASETDGDDLAAAAWGVLVMMELEAKGTLL